MFERPAERQGENKLKFKKSLALTTALFIAVSGSSAAWSKPVSVQGSVQSLKSSATSGLAVDKPFTKTKPKVSKQASAEDCHITAAVKAFLTCTYGATKPTYRIAMTGDSHAMQYRVPVMALAKKYGWSVTFVFKSGCTMLDPAMWPSNMNKSTCRWWNGKRESYFAKQKPFDLVINSNSSFITHNKKNVEESYASTVMKITDTGSNFLLIRDNPKGIDGVEVCSLSKSKLKSGRCDSTLEKALLPLDRLPAAVATNEKVIVADFTDAYCDDVTCFASRFNEKVYRNRSHINYGWAIHLLSRIDAVIPDELKHPR